MTPTLLVIAAYLWGAIPTAYLAGRLLRGIDIRKYGSGNVGASNVTEHVGKKVGLALGIFDGVGKGTLPVLIASILDQSLAIQAGVGIAAVAGHNWSPYIGFTGGRGIATGAGVLLAFGLWEEMLVEAVLVLLIGKVLLKDTGMGTFFGVIALPILANTFGRPDEVVWMTVALGGIVFLKRLVANWELPESEYGTFKVLMFRLLWDRDVPRRVAWTTRAPAQKDRHDATTADVD